ncbi:hypothetical protein FRB96_008832 [Tulasnella sp. 330]|nr:hypothetical protein FRB96_008832 [Tulasnella sp. 330]
MPPLSRRAHVRPRTASDATIHSEVTRAPNEAVAPPTPNVVPAQEFALFSMMPFGRAPAVDQRAQREAKEKLVYPNDVFIPQFGRRHTSMIALSGAIGFRQVKKLPTALLIIIGLLIPCNHMIGTALYDAGPLGILLGYSTWALVVYAYVVSTVEMVTVFPYCHGTVGLANVFVDPALGFAMGWNAWYHWGITIPSQIASATALLKYWDPAAKLAPFWPFLFITFSCGSVFGARKYGELESLMAYIKFSAVILLAIIGLALDFDKSDQPRFNDSSIPGAKMSHNPFKYWDQPFQQYVGVKGNLGQFLGFWATFMQACFSYFGTEIPTIIAGEIKDAPRVLPKLARRVWLRISLLYVFGVFIAGTLVPASSLNPSKKLDLPGSPEDDAPWDGSAFLLALSHSSHGYKVLTNLFVAGIMTSAASAASTEVFIASRYLFFLAEAGHAPKFLGTVWPKDPRQRRKGKSVPVFGVLVTTAFASLSFMCMRPGANTAGGAEQVFKWITSMVAAACLQAWIGTLYTYLRWWQGTEDSRNKHRFEKEIKRIKENRAWGQPYLAIFSLSMCGLILIFNGWSSFKTGVWVIYHSDTAPPFSKNQVVKFVTTYLPIPLLLLLVFGYKLINQTTMTGIADMDFSGVAYEGDGGQVEEKRPTSLWGRIVWFLVC